MTSRAISKYWTALAVLIACSSQADRRPATDRDVVLGSTSQALELSCNFVVAPNGSDTAAGTELAPWKTLSRAFASNSAFMTTGGKTLCLRAGVYSATQLLPSPPSGTETSPTTVRSYPGERATIDTSIAEFRQTGQSPAQWVNDSGDVWRSVQSYQALNVSTYPDPSANALGGFFKHQDDYFALVNYRSLDDLRSSSQLYDSTVPAAGPRYYAGPGIYWAPGGPIYVRLTRPDAAVVGATYTMPVSTDPNQVPLHISYACDPGCVAIGLQGSNITFRDLDLIHAGLAVRNWVAGHHLTFQNVRFHVRTGMYLGNSNNIFIHDSQFECHLPPWIADYDVRRHPQVAGTLFGMAVTGNGISYLFFENNKVDRCFGGVWPLGTATARSHHLDILHNEFTGLREEAVQVGSEADEVEIAYNRFGGDGWAVTMRGTAPPQQPGTVFVHHNSMHSKPVFTVRRTAAGAPITYTGRAPMGGQSAPAVNGGQAPWLIYNNTMVAELPASQALSAGFGQQYLGTRVATPAQVHQVLNNVFSVVGNSRITYGATVSTGQEFYERNGQVLWIRNLIKRRPSFPGPDSSSSLCWLQRAA